MKNFFKKLSFVLAIAMVLTSIAPATASAAEVVPAKKVNLKVNSEKVEAIDLEVGEETTVKVGLPVKKAAKEAGLKSTFKTWYVVDGDAVEVVRVGNRTYELTGVEAGEATITITAAKTKKLAKAGEGKVATLTVAVVDGFGIVDVTAKQANVLEVTFAAPVEATLSVVKGANPVDVTTTWNAAKTVATIKTTAKMTAGTYTVKAVAGESTAEKAIEIENQKVDKIVILNEVALTGKDASEKDAMEAYVYYKVIDQYETDLTASTSIQWSSSCKIEKVDRSEGRITLKRTDDKAFTYGEQIYLNGVYTKTGVVEQATVTVGSAQAVNTIEMAGFVKKGTTTLVQKLPNDFKTNEYYLVFDAKDQNGNTLEASKSYAEDYDQITFISDNVMVVAEIKGGETTIVVDGHEYNAVFVQPGDFVSNGGEFTVTAIASKTGTKTMMNYVVGESPILDSFTMSAPTTLIADNEKVEIPFVALDKNGNTITNFVSLADNLNKLSFSVSAGEVYLVAQNDGTAKLFYDDLGEVTWSDAAATDGIDRTVSVTSVVVGGTSDNLMLYIADMARPDAIKLVNLNPVYLEMAEIELTLKDFLFLDQYGRTMGQEMFLGIIPQDNGFFANSLAGNIKGIDFADYTYGIKAEYKGSNVALVSSAAVTLSAADDTDVMLATGKIVAQTDAQTKNALTGNNFEFAIAKKASDKTEYDNVSTTYNHAFSVVDITQVKNFTVGDLALQFVRTESSNEITGDLATWEDITAAINDTAEIEENYVQKVTLTGSYNGTSVKIPASYYMVNGTKLQPIEVATIGAVEIDALSIDAIKWSDLYDATSARLVRKNTSDILKVSVYEIYSNDADTMGAELDAPKFRDSVNKTVTISDAAPVLTNINLLDAGLVCADNTRIEVGSEYALSDPEAILDAVKIWFFKPFGVHMDVYTDQYGKVATPATISYKVSDIKEAAGYVDGNFTVVGNDTDELYITGAECGDKFTFTVTATQGNVTIFKTATITVGADVKAYVTSDANFYTDGKVYTEKDPVLNDLKDRLEQDRIDILK